MPTERDLAFMSVKYRKDNHLSIVEFAKEIGMSVNVCSKIEQEKPTTKRTFLNVYEYLKEKGVKL